MATVNTFHCICNTLLLSTTHNLSSLPRRSTSSTSGQDQALILPLPSQPPSLSTTDELPTSGYTILLALSRDSKTTIIRREDGFEKRHLHKCQRCNVVVGYEIAQDGVAKTGQEMDIGAYEGRVLYILPGGLMSTQFMVNGGRIGEDKVAIGGNGVAVFE